MIYRMTPKAQATKTKSRQMGLHLTKKLFSAKDTINREKSNSEWDIKYLQIIYQLSVKRLTSRICKECLPLNDKNKKTKNKKKPLAI